MRVPVWFFLTAAATIILIQSPPASAQPGGVGFVKEIQGTAYWRLNKHSKESELDPRRDIGRRLYPEEEVRCTKRLKLWLGYEKNVPCRLSAWFPIPASSQSANWDRNRALLAAYADFRGIDRGETNRIFSPSDHSAALPDEFIIRWIPGPAKCMVSFVIRDVGNTTIWRQDDIEAKAGELKSVDAELKLRQFAAQRDPGPLTLEIADNCRDPERVTFSVLSASAERSLRERLAFWHQQPDGLVSHLGRAAEFHKDKIFPQAAAEYEAALKIAPESSDLLIRTILAHRETGNYLRKQELTRRLPEGTKVP